MDIDISTKSIERTAKAFDDGAYNATTHCQAAAQLRDQDKLLAKRAVLIGSQYKSILKLEESIKELETQVKELEDRWLLAAFHGEDK